MVVRICPACGLQYGDDVVFCHVDGVALEESKDRRLGLTIAGRYNLVDVLGQAGWRRSTAPRAVSGRWR